MVARKAAKAVNEAAAAADVQPDGSGIYLDPELATARDEEMAKLAAIEVEERSAPTIDPQLEQLREAEMKKAPRVF